MRRRTPHLPNSFLGSCHYRREYFGSDGKFTLAQLRYMRSTTEIPSNDSPNFKVRAVNSHITNRDVR